MLATANRWYVAPLEIYNRGSNLRIGTQIASGPSIHVFLFCSLPFRSVKQLLCFSFHTIASYVSRRSLSQLGRLKLDRTREKPCCNTSFKIHRRATRVTHTRHIVPTRVAPTLGQTAIHWSKLFRQPIIPMIFVHHHGSSLLRQLRIWWSGYVLILRIGSEQQESRPQRTQTSLS